MLRVLFKAIPVILPFIKEVFSGNHWIGKNIRDNPDTIINFTVVIILSIIVVYLYMESLRLRSLLEHSQDQTVSYRELVSKNNDLTEEVRYWRDLYYEQLVDNTINETLPPPTPPIPRPIDPPVAVMPSRETANKQTINQLKDSW